MTARKVAILHDRVDRVDRDALTKALRWKGDRIIGDELNVLSALELDPRLRTVVQFDEFAQEMQTAGPSPWEPAASSGRPWADADTLELQRWLLGEGFDIGRGPGRGVLEACLDRHARRRIVHPVRDYLSGLRHDGLCRLDTWLVDYLGAIGPAAYLAAIGRRFLVQAVARVLQPGCQADHTLVLEAPQGAGKSSVVRILGVRPGWVADSIPELGTKDSALQLRGKWLIELAELSAMRRADVESVKAFLTRPVDDYRPPFGRRTVQVPRQCVFFATTNEDLYLQDRTGNRRFWPVRCGDIDLPALAEARDQLWAEAVVAFRAGEPWHLAGDEIREAQAQQVARVYVSELEQGVVEFLDQRAADGVTEVEMRQVLAALNIDPHDVGQAGRFGPQVAHILTRHGWHKLDAVGRGPSRRVRYRRALS